ncbi:hypothetical protein B0T26DRAFT_829343, partial [Lasiosphaeria miniovina]
MPDNPMPDNPMPYNPRMTVFGVPLRASIEYARNAVIMIDGEGRFHNAGYIPIIVGEVGNFLKAEGNLFADFDRPSHEQCPPYLCSSYEAFREPLRNLVTEGPALTTSVPDHKPPPVIFKTFLLNQNALITSYKQLVWEIPPVNREILLYLLDTLALFANNSDKTNVPTSRLAVVFQALLLTHPQHYTSQDDIRLNQAVIIFFIENE